MNKYDLLIIGSGPAGLSASIYASRYKINQAIVGEISGGLMSEAHKVCNFPTEIDINGFDLTMKMKAHVESFGTKILADKVTKIEKQEDKTFYVTTSANQEFVAKTILLATGTVHQHLGLENEGKFLGHGLSYCSTCDAMFFKNQIVAVVGSGNSALTASLHLAEIAEKVYLVVRHDVLKGETTWADQVRSNKKIEILFNTNVVSLQGAEKLTGIKLDKEYSGSDTLPTTGLFVEIGSTPDTAWLQNLDLEYDKFGYIKVNGDQSTSQDGVYAAGDITTGSNQLRQIITACAEGSVAATSIFRKIKEAK
jgi:thioredoxin reductase (NADPH)